MEESAKAKAYKKLCASNDKYAENYDKIDWGRSTSQRLTKEEQELKICPRYFEKSPEQMESEANARSEELKKEIYTILGIPESALKGKQNEPV
jgi:hypothetical protein